MQVFARVSDWREDNNEENIRDDIHVAKQWNLSEKYFCRSDKIESKYVDKAKWKNMLWFHIKNIYICCEENRIKMLISQ